MFTPISKRQTSRLGHGTNQRKCTHTHTHTENYIKFNFNELENEVR